MVARWQCWQGKYTNSMFSGLVLSKCEPMWSEVMLMGVELRHNNL